MTGRGAPTPARRERSSLPPLGPELQLLLGAARTTLDAEQADGLRELCRSPLDWSELLETAHRQGVLPLLYRNLAAICPEAVPPSILDRLRGRFRESAANSLLLVGELVRILDLLEARHIPAIPYKGPLLALRAYRHVTLRPFGDLDILIRRHDVLRAKEILCVSGYRPELVLSRAEEGAHLARQCEYNFSGDGGRVWVELHWEVVPRLFSSPIDQGKLWECAEWTSLQGRPVQTLSAEHALLVVCVHGAKHLWTRLKWICDVAELIDASPDLRWGALLAEARARGGERMLLLGLALANALLATALPPGVLGRIGADRTVAALARLVQEWLFGEDENGAPPPQSLGRLSFYLRMRERPADRARHCIQLATSPTIGDWRWLSLPGRLAFLYPVLRPFRLLGKFGPRLFRF